MDIAKIDRIITIEIDEENQGIRLDKALAIKLSDISRTYLSHLIVSGNVSLKNNPQKPTPKLKLRSGDLVEIAIPALESASIAPEDIPLNVIYEDEYVLVINKAPSMVVHPGAGNPSGTLVNAILHRIPDLAGINGTLRPGIVHRLDKDTSGVMVVAKNTVSQLSIVQQFQEGTVEKRYVALVKGNLRDDAGMVNLPIGRHPVDRKKMAVTSRGRQAQTQWKLLERFGVACLVSVVILTGRTHQIRVHMSHIGHPVLGDVVYGTGTKLSTKAGVIGFSRQMLHAQRLSLLHPATKERMTFEVEMPIDMVDATIQLRDLHIRL